MLSNASVPGLSALPASLSRAVVDELRLNLGFNGLIMTDSLGTGAISALHLSIPAASVKALEAGADQILFGNQATPSASLQVAGEISTATVAAVKSGALARSALVNAAARVVATRNAVACPGVPATSTTL